MRLRRVSNLEPIFCRMDIVSSLHILTPQCYCDRTNKAYDENCVIATKIIGSISY
jgi:hypothetical protein